ncbi:MAG: hypothetical protein ACR2NN_02065 [Bryobacteraceae bacterium]
MSSSNLRMLANRENAQRSTSPRATKGKQRSSLNALRHGLTGQVVVLPGANRELYQSFCQGYLDEWKRKGPTETNLVQTLAEQQWRLHRAHARERDAVNTENLEVHALVAAAPEFKILQTERRRSLESR